jgi:hypothetical protein
LTDPIRFTSYLPDFTESDFWGGIEFYDATGDTSRFEYCVIENIKRPEEHGAVYMNNSLVSIRNSKIHNNYSLYGGAIFADNVNLKLAYNTIENNTAEYAGGAVFICDRGSKYSDYYMYKNIIMNNIVAHAESSTAGGGGISIVETDPVESSFIIRENDIIANKVYGYEGLSGTGGGINIISRAAYMFEISGNKIMYNKAGTGGGVTITHPETDYVRKHTFTNNIISNNTADHEAGGIYYQVFSIRNPQDIIFENNDMVNNLNKDAKTGSGGLYITFSGNGNFFLVKNSIFWNNSRAGTLNDAASYPSVYPGNFIKFSDTTSYFEGEGNISSKPLYQRSVTYYGADPYENYLRGDYHISLESPCVDAGDPKTPSIEPDGTTVNIGAYGNTEEAITSIYESIYYTGPISLNIKRGETKKLDCRNFKDIVELNELIVEDGGQVYIAANNTSPVIRINNLVTYGTKIGDRYTTRIQRMETADQNEFKYNILEVRNVDVTGAVFNNMAVNVNSTNIPKIIDSKIYVYDYNQNLNGVTVSAPDGDVSGNVIDNFGIGVYFNGAKSEKATKGRITNNTIRFDADVASKGETKAKGVKVENCNADVSGNDVYNPNEGVEASASSGRITNNTVRFDADVASKGVPLKRAVYIFGGGNYEVDHNRIISDDILTAEIRALDVSGSLIDANYNIIDFGSKDYGTNKRTGFYGYSLSKYSIFINNTVYNSSLGIDGVLCGYDTRIFNNIFYGPKDSYLTADTKCLVLYNNDIKGSVNTSSIVEEIGTINSDPYFQSSKVNDFYLWYESPCINKGYFMSEYHTYGTTYYGDAPDIGAVEFYQESSFYAPQNLTSSVTGTTLTLTWSSVPDALSYNIYGSERPYDTFTLIKNVTGTSWSASTSAGTKYFYYVTAVRDGVKSVTDNIDIKDNKSKNDSRKKLLNHKKMN